MKLNKTLITVALVAVGLLTTDATLLAQSSTNTPPAGVRPPRAGMNIETIASQLDLTDDQKTKAKPVFDEMRQKLADLHKDSSLSQTDKRSKFKEIRDDTNAKLKEILTSDQYAKWMKMPGNRRPPGGAGAPPPAGNNPQQQ